MGKMRKRRNVIALLLLLCFGIWLNSGRRRRSSLLLPQVTGDALHDSLAAQASPLSFPVENDKELVEVKARDEAPVRGISVSGSLGSGLPRGLTDWSSSNPSRPDARDISPHAP